MTKSIISNLAIMVFLAASIFANTAPTVVIQSATMRAGTTLMDVVYRVNDPDDATVKVRALAFTDGVRSFSSVLRPVTFAEGTEVNLGDTIATNADHTLTWNVAADWNVDLGQVKFEVLAMDGRGLLPIDWITIPAAAGKPELTISKDAPTDAQSLDALFWQYAVGDVGLTLENGVLRGTVASGIFSGLELVNGIESRSYATPYVLKIMDLDWADLSDIPYAEEIARAGLLNVSRQHAVNRPYPPAGRGILVGWGDNSSGQIDIPIDFMGFEQMSGIAASRKQSVSGRHFSLALKSEGTVVGWGDNYHLANNIPAGLNGVTAIAMGNSSAFALKSDGTVTGWGDNGQGQTDIPEGLSNVIAIAAGNTFCLALKSDGTVVGWGSNVVGQLDIPEGLDNVIAIAVNAGSSGVGLALKSDGTVVAWGGGNGAKNVPAGLTDVTAIAAGLDFGLALKSDGTVVGWGYGAYGASDIPEGLDNVTAISAGKDFSIALKSDGTVVGWGNNDTGQIDFPAGLNGVTHIAAGTNFGLAIKASSAPETE